MMEERDKEIEEIEEEKDDEADDEYGIEDLEDIKSKEEINEEETNKKEVVVEEVEEDDEDNYDDEYGIEDLEDLKTRKEINDDERDEKERIRKKIPFKYKRKGDILDYNYPEIYLNDSQVRKEMPYSYCSMSVYMKPSQRNLICFVQQHSGMRERSDFIRHVLLRYCRDYMKLIQIKREVDIKFRIDYKKLIQEELMVKNEMKERLERLKKLKKTASSQDDGGEPFTTDDLME